MNTVEMYYYSKYVTGKTTVRDRNINTIIFWKWLAGTVNWSKPCSSTCKTKHHLFIMWPYNSLVTNALYQKVEKAKDKKTKKKKVDKLKHLLNKCFRVNARVFLPVA